MNYFLGIDIAKTNHVASLINNTGDVVIRAIKFTNSNEGFNKLLTTIQDKLGDLSNIEVAMEATGHYWLSLYSALTDNNFNVSVYNPYQVKSYRGAYNNRKQKNDIIDSIIIADYLRVFGSKESKFPEEKLLSLKQLTRFRANIVANVSSLKVQVIGLLDKVFPEYKNKTEVIYDINDSNFISKMSVIEYGYDEINLNLGCPSGTVVSKGRGSGFLAKPEELDRFLDDIFSQCEVPISVKTRLGRYSPDEFPELLEIYNRYPIEELTIHPRIRDDYYKNTPNLDMFEYAVEHSKNPLCYNGDITTVEEYERF